LSEANLIGASLNVDNLNEAALGGAILPNGATHSRD
jgi:uncharacterized protein YjbI with pentapeptide repeats